MKTFTAKLKKWIFGDERVRRMGDLIGAQKQMLTNVADVKKWADGGTVKERGCRQVYSCIFKSEPDIYTGGFNVKTIKICTKERVDASLHSRYRLYVEIEGVHSESLYPFSEVEVFHQLLISGIKIKGTHYKLQSFDLIKGNK